MMHIMDEKQAHLTWITSRKCLLLALPFLLIIFCLSLTPVIERDALIHHLALPKIWLKNGAFKIDTFRIFSFYPANLHILYYISLKMHLDFLPKFIHSLFLLLTSVLVYTYIKQHTNKIYLAVLAFILIISIPINQRLASESYVDLGLLFFSMLSLLYFLQWKNSDFNSKKYFYISAIGSGLAIGTKYNGLIPFLIINFFVMFSFSRRKKENLGSLMYGMQFFTISFLLASPWLIRNYYVSGGNPFYPLFHSIFPNSLNILVPLYQDEYNEFLFRRASGESHLEIFLLPLRFFFTGEDNNFLQFDGKLNPMMLLLLPALFLPLPQRKNRYDNTSSDKLYLLIFSFFILFVSSQILSRTRYVIPIVPSLVILNVLAIDKLLNFKNIYVIYFTFLLTAFYIGYNVKYTFEIFNKLNIYKYITLRETRESYLRRELPLYTIYEFINKNTPQNAVIYDVLCGHRSYYVDREYIYAQSDLDTYFYNYAFQEKPASAYLEYLGNMRSSVHKVTHLLIKPAFFIDSFKEMFYDPDDPEGSINDKKLRNFIAFLHAQKMLFQADGAILYELVYDNL